MNILILAAHDNFALNLLRNLNGSSKKYVIGNKSLRGTALSRLCFRYIGWPKDELENPSIITADKINEFCMKNRIDVIIPADMQSAMCISSLKDKILQAPIFPISDKTTLMALNNKWEFWKMLHENGIPAPRTKLLTSINNLEIHEEEFPVIVKPLNMGYRIGVKKICSLDEIKRHVCSNEYYAQLPLIYQEYVQGEDVDLNILAKNGKIAAWSIQKWLNEDTIEFLDNEEILKIGEKIVFLTKYEGVAHFDMRIDERDNSIKVLECNPRFWGSLRASKWNGVNFAELGIKMALRQELPSRFENKRIKYMLPSRLLSKIIGGNLTALIKAPPYTWLDLLQIISDPLSCGYDVWNKISQTNP